MALRRHSRRVIRIDRDAVEGAFPPKDSSASVRSVRCAACGYRVGDFHVGETAGVDRAPSLRAPFVKCPECGASLDRLGRPTERARLTWLNVLLVIGELVLIGIVVALVGVGLLLAVPWERLLSL